MIKSLKESSNLLKSFMNFKKISLYELNSITECETAKILETPLELQILL